jgi:cell wall-associated NlpC family hydrolase
MAPTLDRRLTPATARIAHVSLAGRTELPLTTGEALRIGLPLVDLLREPNGARERQLWLGESVTAIEKSSGHVFVMAGKDGYCGWLPSKALVQSPAPSHWVAAPASHLYPEPRVQARETARLPMGAMVRVIGEEGAFCATPDGHIPRAHLRPLGAWESDPVAVAEGLLGTPYLWGGNSREGIDCSGLVQLCHHVCGIGLPGDADLQEAALPAATGGFRRGDLLFWRGHVALVVDETRLIHANGHSMSVAYEGIAECLARIEAAEGHGLRHHARP